MKQFESVFTRGLLVAALCLTAGIAEPGGAEETTRGTDKLADTSAFRVAPDSPEAAVTGAQTGQSSAARFPGPAAGRVALAQPGCSICLGGTGSIHWTGGTGSFHVDTVTNNRASGTSGSLALSVVLTSSAPVYGQTIYPYSFSDSYSLNPLLAGYQYSNVNSGTVGMYGTSIPVGQYWQLLYLREYSGGTWYYEDWIVMPNKVSCNGAACTVVTSCTEDAYTMCLVNGRYRVTSHWKNQYATTPVVANLSKAKLTDKTGAFWIADADTYEYLIRFNTATNNGKIWINVTTFTSVEFWVEVTDTVNGQTKEYHNAPGDTTMIWDPYFFDFP